MLSPFVKRIAEKHDRESAEGRCAHKVSELRVEATPDIDHEEPALNVLMILDEDELPRLPEGSQVDDDRIDRLIGAGRTAAAEAVHQAGDPVAKREAWMALAECWIKPAVELVPTVDGVGSVEITVLNGEEFSYARSLSAPILDLRYLRPARPDRQAGCYVERPAAALSGTEILLDESGSCPPLADPMIRRHFRWVAGGGLASPDVGSNCVDGGSQWLSVAWKLPPLAPHLAPLDLVIIANVRVDENSIDDAGPREIVSANHHSNVSNGPTLPWLRIRPQSSCCLPRR